MICPYCKTELIWGSDSDNEDGTISSYYTCPGCESEIIIIK